MHRVRAGLSHHPHSVSLKWIATRLQMGTWTYVSKDVFHAGIKGMERGRQRGQFYFSRGRSATFGEESVNSIQQTLQFHGPRCLGLPWRGPEVGKLPAPCYGEQREDVWRNSLLVLYCSSIIPLLFLYFSTLLLLLAPATSRYCNLAGLVDGHVHRAVRRLHQALGNK